MSASRWQTMLTAATILMLAAATGAQTRRPQIGYVYPAGGQRGTEVEVSVGGRYLRGITSVVISGRGVQAKIVRREGPVFGKKANALREELKKLREKRKGALAKPGAKNRPAAGKDKPAAAKDTPAAGTRPAFTEQDKQRALEIAKILFDSKKRQQNPAIAETVVLKLTIAADAGPGSRELRLVGKSGLSNPMVLMVGQWPETRETESAAAEIPRYIRSFIGLKPSPKAKLDAEMTVEIPTIVNGQILPGDADRYRFRAAKGQKIVVAADARRLVPYLADAVPGWFQAVVALYDGAGRELAYVDDFRFSPDPVFCYKIPADGEYVVEIRDSIYRGREDFVYRLTIGELPYVTSLFPLGGRAGAETPVAVMGWNLPTRRMKVSGADVGVIPVTVRAGNRVTNALPFAVDLLPDRLETEPNSDRGVAERIELGTIINGRVDQPGDVDVYRFDGRKGGKIVAEIYARRLDSPLDSQLRLTDADGKQVAFSDDVEDKGAGLTTHHADSRISVTLPASGTYFLHVGDTQNSGGPAYAYRLRVSPPRPDFALRVVPSSISARAGTHVPVTVYALRRDGFTGSIALRLVDAPAGFRLTGAKIPAGADRVRMTMSVPRTPAAKPVSLSLQGSATVGGRKIHRTAAAAEDMMQAFLWRHLVPTDDWVVSVIGRRRWGPEIRVLGDRPVKLPAGSDVTVRVATPKGPFLQRVALELDGPPAGVAIKKVSPGGDGLNVVLAVDGKKATPGLRGNLIVKIFMQGTSKPKDGKGTGRKWRVPVGVLPAIPFEVTDRPAAASASLR